MSVVSCRVSQTASSTKYPWELVHFRSVWEHTCSTFPEWTKILSANIEGFGAVHHHRSHMHRESEAMMRQGKIGFGFIDLFAGIGGLCMGFDRNCCCVFTSEWNRFSQETYRANFQDDLKICGGITRFPCQPFLIVALDRGPLGAEISRADFKPALVPFSGNDFASFLGCQ